jgi:hypothetical protein
MARWFNRGLFQLAFEGYVVADHIAHEPGSFRLAGTLGLSSLIILMVLLCDRYFPKLWPRLAPHHQSSAASMRDRPMALYTLTVIGYPASDSRCA